ncbi:phosphatidylethanolamine-binding protein [Cladorrhinum sp. PSN259]|nr:phosphatidylethanolamine-binding protein [Cladorrhinum sp. PSN259]
MADDNAQSVSTLDFKNRFVSSGIVPEVIAALDPAVSFYVTYRKDGDGHSELITPGSTLSLNETSRLPLEFSVENLNNATNITAQTRYLIYLVRILFFFFFSLSLDADAPSRSSPTARNLRHYLAGNYTLNGANSSVLDSAQRLAIPEANRRPFTAFTAPKPDANTGIHRFIYALYTQPARFNTAGFESVGMEAATGNWNLSRWRTQLGLGPAIGATFFTVDTGSSVNGGSNTTGNGGAAGSGAMGLEARGYMAGLMALGAVLGGLVMV